MLSLEFFYDWNREFLHENTCLLQSTFNNTYHFSGNDFYHKLSESVRDRYVERLTQGKVKHFSVIFTGVNV